MLEIDCKIMKIISKFNHITSSANLQKIHLIIHKQDTIKNNTGFVMNCTLTKMPQAIKIILQSG